MGIKNFAIILQKLHLLNKLRNFVYVNITYSTANELAIIYWDFNSKIHNVLTEITNKITQRGFILVDIVELIQAKLRIYR